MTELTTLSVTELTSGLKARSFSAVELYRAFRSKIDDNSDLNAFITLSDQVAQEQAKSADERLARGESLPLLGIPVAVKDVFITKDILTTCGSKILANFIPPYESTVTSKLKTAGAIIVGKTNMDEFAMGSSNENSSYGPVKNPWDKTRVPGGSSGGSAAAVAARLSPVALGTDTGGSIRQPASFCNIVGIKPTYGRVSRYGLVAFASSLDQAGAFAQNVSDAALLTQVISGFDPNDSTSMQVDNPVFTPPNGNDLKGMRIGIPKEYFIEGLNSEVESAVRSAIAKLVELGATVVDISLPHTKAAVATYYILAPAEASSNLARFDGIRYGYRSANSKTLNELYCNSRSEGFGPEVKRRIMIGSYVLSAGYFDAYYLRAQKVRTLIVNDFKQAFSEKCDLIACPTAPTTAFKAGEKVSDPIAMYLNDVFTIPVNLAGLPAMSIPCGFDATGLPIGLHLIAKPWDESTLFRVGLGYESVTDWHTRRPNGY